MEKKTHRDLGRRAVGRRVVIIVLLCSGLLLAGGAIWLGILNGSFAEDPLIVLNVGLVLTYAVVGSVIALRLPANPIGWLFLAAGLGMLVSGASGEYATYALITSPGSLPAGRAAAWVGTLGIISVAAIPLILVLFPTGRVPSRRWRWVPQATLVAAIGLVFVGAFEERTIDVAVNVSIENPAFLGGIDAWVRPLTWFFGLLLLGASIASVVAIVSRFRASSGDERQQLRWFASIAAATGICLIAVLLTGLGGTNEESNLPNDIALAAFFLCLTVGLPVACAIAVLKFRLWDLDVVIKKTVVFVTVVVGLMALGAIRAVVATTVVGGTRYIYDHPSLLFLWGLALGVLAIPLLRISTRIADRVVYGGRATPYEVMTEFSGRLADAYANDDVLPRTAAVVGDGTGAQRVTIWLLVGDVRTAAASWPDHSTTTSDGATAFEVRHQGELLGSITVEMPAADPMNPAKERLIRDLAGQAGLVLRNVRLIEELRASRRRIVAAQDERAKKLERNIHDGAQQQLVALAVKQRLLGGLIGRDDDRAKAMVEELAEETNDALENLRDLARGIYPPLLADKGLAAALEAQARKATISTSVDADGLGRLPQAVESAVYFSCLEALQNVAKYADASHATITIRNGSGELRFSVTDDGRGFDPDVIDYGTGLQGIADRLSAIGGELTVTSQPGRGATIAGTVPA
jgi:signal transduction histidine kinase